MATQGYHETHSTKIPRPSLALAAHRIQMLALPLMPIEQIVALLIAERDRLTRAIDAPGASEAEGTATKESAGCEYCSRGHCRAQDET